MAGKLKKWFGKDDGVVAVEFALLALPFFTMLMGTLESAMFYASSIVMEGAAAEASRSIRTGQAQTSTEGAEAMFEAELCDQVGTLIPCTDIQYEVFAMPTDTFAEVADFEPEFDADGNFQPRPFDAGNSCDVVLIRAVYKYEFLTPFIGNLMNGGAGNDAATLMSTTVIKNEPYTGIASC